ncbi:hypothetical protein [Haloarcula halophila]|uniref:hypothetical protein n=1 Tax=Halomicroarcula sp. GCM10025335 TaxID=3252668 RepID=UPI003613B76D
MNRRALLAAVGAAVPSLGGCLASAPGGSQAPEPTATPQARTEQSPSSTDSPTETAVSTEATTDDQPTLSDSRGPTRGESDAEVTTEVVETDENVEYVESEHAVRYVAAWKHTNHEEVKEGAKPEREPVYETVPFEQWARTEAFTAAARAAAEHANGALGTDEVGSGITSSVDGTDLAPFVSVETVLDREGEIVSETSVTFDRLVAVTPATVGVTYRLDDQSVQSEAPIYARYSVLQQA